MRVCVRACVCVHVYVHVHVCVSSSIPLTSKVLFGCCLCNCNLTLDSSITSSSTRASRSLHIFLQWATWPLLSDSSFWTLATSISSVEEGWEGEREGGGRVRGRGWEGEREGVGG